jgi:dTDP-4-amino-4,6-dideoxygalactose transaminase
LRYGGTVKKEDCLYPSLNGRIDTMHAAMLLVMLDYLEDKINDRVKIAKKYGELLSGIEQIKLPVCDDSFHVYYSYTICADNRDDLMEYLTKNGIETKIQHPILMPYHTANKGKYRADIPNAERLVKRILCLPNQEDIDDQQIEYIAEKIKEFYS